MSPAGLKENCETQQTTPGAGMFVGTGAGSCVGAALVLLCIQILNTAPEIWLQSPLVFETCVVCAL